MAVQVANQDRDHFSERRGLAAERHRPIALNGRKRFEQQDERGAIRAHLSEQRFDVEGFAFADASAVPVVCFELGGVFEVVTRGRDTGADADADELAEVVRGHVGEELAASPGAVASVDEFIPWSSDGADCGFDAVNGFTQGLEQRSELGIAQRTSASF